jgi:hypothetical protein
VKYVDDHSLKQPGQRLWQVWFHDPDESCGDSPIDVAAGLGTDLVFVTGASRNCSGGDAWITTAYRASTGKQAWSMPYGDPVEASGDPDVHHRLVMFAGFTDPANPTTDNNDTFVGQWSTGTGKYTWTQASPSATPGARCCVGLAFQSGANNAIILFGGGDTTIAAEWATGRLRLAGVHPAPDPFSALHCYVSTRSRGKESAGELI